MKSRTAGLLMNSSSYSEHKTVSEGSQSECRCHFALLVHMKPVLGGSALAPSPRCKLDLAEQHLETEITHTLSMPSISRPRLVPRGPCGTAELLSSLARAEEPGSSEPPRRLFIGGGGGLPRRCASMSFLRFIASSLDSSVYRRSRSCDTQSSHLRQSVSGRRLRDRQSYAAVTRMRACSHRKTSHNPRQLFQADGDRYRRPRSLRVNRDGRRHQARGCASDRGRLTCSSSPCNGRDIGRHPSCRSMGLC